MKDSREMLNMYGAWLKETELANDTFERLIREEDIFTHDLRREALMERETTSAGIEKLAVKGALKSLKVLENDFVLQNEFL